MNIFNIITKSISRRKTKYLFLLIVILLGVTITTGLTEFSSTMNREITKKMEKYGANIVILPGMESLPLAYGGISLGSLSYDMKSLKQKDLLKLKTIKNSGNIAASGAFLLGIVEIKNKKVLICGIEMKTIPYLRPWWDIKKNFPQKNEILVGKEASRLLNLKKNDSVSINNKKLSIKTILKHTGSQDDNIIFVELATAQALLNQKGIISFAEVAALCAGCPIDEMVRQISGVLPKARVSGIKQVIGARMQSISMIRTFTSATSIVVILLSILMISVVMMGNVRDRTSELGLYRAIGFKKSHIKTLVLGEVFTVSFVAGIIGYILGVILANGILRIMGEPSVIIVLPNILHGLLAISTTVIIALIAGSFPARTAARLDPVSALRHL